MTDRRALANAIRFLSIDAVQAANSGHPGAPMGMADIAEVVWRGVLRHNPADPQWPNRDRFILSNGHGSMLIYSLLHLTGYDVTIEDLKSFRQLHSRTPGHPEYGYTAGVETTTGPLGQGLANAVGMALAERTLAAQFNRDDFPIVDHHTYCFVGDGCLMEGVSHEACSLAGTLGLGQLIVFYDDNGISIDGDVRGWFSDDTPARFESYGWQVIRGVDGHDATEIETALKTARQESSRPTLICCRTVIGFGSPNLAGSEKTHGAPLGDAEIQATRDALGWTHGPFEVPADIRHAWDATEAGAKAQAEWAQLFARYREQYPELAAEFERRVSGELPADAMTTLDQAIRQTQSESPKLATRKASQNAIEVVAKVFPEVLGGSADLGHSNLTVWPDCQANTVTNPGGNYLHYGVREFAMCALMNGVALHGGFLPFGGTFLIFMEYARNAVRMAALMKQRVIYVFTHDSIGLGEDGPTHQPIEQLASLRATPGLETWRPCDTTETFVAWKEAVAYQGPTALTLSRQGLANQPRDDQQLADIARGGYVLKPETGALDLIVIATGSEVELAVAAADILGSGVRVVSMPSTSRFDQQDASYRESVLPSACAKRLAIEAGHPDGWYKYVGLQGAVIGMRSFGESGPGGEVMKHFGFTVDHVVETAKALQLAWRLGINGYGRIGRCVVRALAERGLFDRIQPVLINDPADAESLVHLTHYDSTHGRSERLFQKDPHGGYLLNGRSIALTHHQSPSEIAYPETPVDVVLESSGRFANRDSADAHRSQGAPRVLIGAPGGPDVDLTVVYGLNHLALTESHRVISAASCTTNCLALGVFGLTRSVSIERGFYTTIHAVTNDQVLIDTAHRDLRRGRSAHSSMIPTSTNAIKALEWVMPELSGRIQGFSMRVPTQNVSCVDLTVEFSREVTETEIMDAMHQWSQIQGGLFAVNEEPLVSIDFNHHPASSIFDATQLMVNGRLVKLLFWYDNEWGYSNRVIDLLLHWQSISRE